MKTPEEKYMHDPQYRALVRMLEAFIHKADFTPSEIREAALYATILYEQRNTARPLFAASAAPKGNDHVEG